MLKFDFEIFCLVVVVAHTQTHTRSYKKKNKLFYLALSLSLSSHLFLPPSILLCLFGIAGLLELSLNQAPYDFDSNVAMLLESQLESPHPTLRSATATTTLRRAKLRSRKKRRTTTAAATTTTTTATASTLDAATATKKKLSHSLSAAPLQLQQRKNSAATLARNAEMRDDGKLQCPQCPNAYTRLSALKRHIEFECGMLENFYCSVCDAGFKRKDSLNRHCKVKKHITKYLF